MERIIAEVNNIFDSAYFKKLNQPERSDEDCFFEAEREYCEEKEIDHLVYRLHMERPQAVEKVRNEVITRLAYQRYLWLIKRGQAGDEYRDWEYAEKEYPRWKAKQGIAEICYNLAPDPSQSQDDYWTLAGKVIEELQTQGIPYVDVDPSEPRIQEIISNFVNRNVSSEPGK
jgi:hypothetical protein